MKNPIDFNKLMEGKTYSDIGGMDNPMPKATCDGCFEVKVSKHNHIRCCGLFGSIIDERTRRITTKCPKGVY